MAATSTESSPKQPDWVDKPIKNAINPIYSGYIDEFLGASGLDTDQYEFAQSHYAMSTLFWMMRKTKGTPRLRMVSEPYINQYKCKLDNDPPTDYISCILVITNGLERTLSKYFQMDSNQFGKFLVQYGFVIISFKDQTKFMLFHNMFNMYDIRSFTRYHSPDSINQTVPKFAPLQIPLPRDTFTGTPTYKGKMFKSACRSYLKRLDEQVKKAKAKQSLLTFMVLIESGQQFISWNKMENKVTFIENEQMQAFWSAEFPGWQPRRFFDRLVQAYGFRMSYSKNQNNEIVYVLTHHKLNTLSPLTLLNIERATPTPTPTVIKDMATMFSE